MTFYRSREMSYY